LDSVDIVTTLEEDRPLSLIERWKPELYAKGGDYREDSLRSREAVLAYGGQVIVIGSAFSSSSSAMMARIAALFLHATPERAQRPPSRGLALLDRDGTLIRNVPFLHDPKAVELLPGVVEGLKLLKEFDLAIVTNQQGIGLGYFDEAAFLAVNQRLLGMLGPHGIRIAKIYHCPHSLAEQCSCRKPGTGMIERAMRDFLSTPETTFVIGDSEADIEAGNRIGCRTIASCSRIANCTYQASDFLAAARWIATAIED
jgi:D-glycero-D-manno-heptose 1,7-bisphosphate phosphatase